ncbi:ABC-three component system middle component 8 [Sinomonas soli]
MLTPNKHSHPDETVVAAATDLLGALIQERLLSYDELRARLRERLRDADFLFTPALDFLYILGVVEYRPTIDSFEYVGRDETL